MCGGEVLKKQKKATGIETGPVKDQKKVVKQQAPLPEVRISDATYFERMLVSASDQNLALSIRVEDDLTKLDGEWAILSGVSSDEFEQQLPVAKKEGKFTSAEKDSVKEAKKTFADADLCTVREIADMREYLKDNDGKIGPELSAVQKQNDRTVQGILDVLTTKRLDMKMFTDDYLSLHMAELFDYCQKVESFVQLRTDHPDFFQDLSEMDVLMLNNAVDMKGDLQELLTMHMKLHGVEMSEKEGSWQMSLIASEKDAKKRQKQQESLKTTYEQKRELFIEKRIFDADINMARLMAGNDAFKKENVTAPTKALIQKDEMKTVTGIFGGEIETVMTEIDKTLTIRDELLAQQAVNVAAYENAAAEDKIRFRKVITDTAKKITLCSQHSNHYQRFLSYLTGEIPGMSPETLKFLRREGHGELADLATYKISEEEKAKKEKKQLSQDEFVEHYKNMLETQSFLNSEQLDGVKKLDDEAVKKIQELQAKKVEKDSEEDKKNRAELAELERKRKVYGSMRDMLLGKKNDLRPDERRYLSEFLARTATEENVVAAVEEKYGKKAETVQAEKKDEGIINLGWNLATSEIVKKDPKDQISDQQDLKEKRKVFPDADAVTLRTFSAMEDYARSGGHKMISGQGKASDAVLRSYVQYVTGFKLDIKNFDTDYLALHIAELYDYTEYLWEFKALEKENPEFFEELGIEERAILESRVDMVKEITAVLSAFMSHNGVVCMRVPKEDPDEQDKDQKDKDQGEEEEQKKVEYTYKIVMMGGRKSSKRREEDRKSTQTRMDIAKMALKDTLERGADVNMAAAYAKSKHYGKAEVDIAFLNERLDELLKDKAISDKYGEEINKCRKALETGVVENESWLVAQENMVKAYKSSKGEARVSWRYQLLEMNDKIFASSVKIKSYTELLGLILGERVSISPEAATFLFENGESGLYSRFIADVMTGTTKWEYKGKPKKQKKEEKDDKPEGLDGSSVTLKEDDEDYEEEEATGKKKVKVTDDKGGQPVEKKEKPKEETPKKKDVKADSKGDDNGDDEQPKKTQEQKEPPVPLGDDESMQEIDVKGKKVQVKVLKDDSPQLIAAQAAPKVFKKEDYPEERKAEFEAKLTEKKIAIPKNMDELAQIRAKFMETKYYLDKGQLKGDTFWKLNTEQSVKEAFEWLKGYYRSRAIDDDSGPEQKLVKLPLPKVNYTPDDFRHIRYERQTTNNCWCCAGTAMLNRFCYTEGGKKPLKKLYRQTDLRGFVPKRDPDQYQKLTSKPGAPYFPKEDFDRAWAATDRFAGASKDKMGSIFEMGDFFLQERPDCMINRMTFHNPNPDVMTEKAKEEEPTIFNNQKAVFMTQVDEILRSGNFPALLTYDQKGEKHYRTIIGIKGQSVKLLDSDSPNPKPYFQPLDHILKGARGRSVELTWLSKMKTPQELQQEFSNLTYDEENGFDVKEMQYEAMVNVAQHDGVCVGKVGKDMDPNMRHISVAAYIPKHMPKAG